MKKAIAITILCLVLGIGTYAQQTDGWQTFSLPNEKLTVSAPCPPKLGAGSTDPSVKIVEYECIHDRALFFLQTTKFKWIGERATKDEMDMISKGFVQGAKGQLLSQSEISVGEVAGRELVLKMTASGAQAKTRLYFLRDTVHTVSVMIDGSAASFPLNADKFLNSVTFKK